MKCWNWNGHAATPPTCESRCQKTTTHLKKKPSALRNWILLTHRSPSIVSVSALGTSEETRISSCWHPLSFIRETYIHKTWQGVLSFVKKQIRLAKKKTIESASVGWWFGSCETLLCLFIWIHFNLGSCELRNHVVQRRVLQQLLARQLSPPATGMSIKIIFNVSLLLLHTYSFYWYSSSPG